MSTDLNSLLSTLAGAGLRFYHRLIRTLILPNNAAPNDPAIIIGPDLPPCMQAAYSSAIFFRPPNTASDAINRPIKFIAQAINPVSGQVDEGWALWDQNTPATICGYYVYKTTITPLAPIGSGNSVPQEYFNSNAEVGSASMTFGGGTYIGTTALGGPNHGWSLNIGDGVNPPSKAGFNVDGKVFGRGLIGWVSTNVSGAATVAETQTLGIVCTIKDGRAYRINCEGQVLTSVANQAAFITIRRTNTAGPVLLISGVNATFTTVANHYRLSVTIINSSGADITDNILQDISRAAGAGTVQNLASVGQPTWMEVVDIGAASDYSGAIQF